jgi:cytochrome c oxidase subunit 1
VFNFFYSIFRGRKVRELNPWGGTTLEWTTPIHPKHGNWPGELPTVYRWAYDYGVGGREFIPQNEPEPGMVPEPQPVHNDPDTPNA